MKRPQTKLILFDLDGTLAQSLEIGLDTMNVLRFVFGYPKLSRHDPRLRQKSGIRFVRDVLKLNMVQFFFWMKLMKFLMSRQAEKIPIYAGWKETITKLKQSHKLGIITSSGLAYTQIILHRAGINCFDIIKADIKYHRKDQTLESLLASEHVLPQQVLYIGDELRDLEAAQKVKMPFVAVNWGKDDESVFAASSLKLRGVLHQPEDLWTYV